LALEAQLEQVLALALEAPLEQALALALEAPLEQALALALEGALEGAVSHLQWPRDIPRNNQHFCIPKHVRPLPHHRGTVRSDCN